MAKKKTPPEYGESDCCNVSFCYNHAMVAGLSLINLVTGFPESGRDEDQDKKRLTGPMMVACQWNYSNPSSQYIIFHATLESAMWSRAHPDTLMFSDQGWLEGDVLNHRRWDPLSTTTEGLCGTE
jgi:hypothetical protein